MNARSSLLDVIQLDLSLRGLPSELAGLRIMHVSDFHFRRWNRVVQGTQDILLTMDYDLLVATGDFGAQPKGWKSACELTRRFFEPIAYRVPIYGVLGNHDFPDLAEESDAPLIILRNQSVLIEHVGISLEIVGVDQRFPGTEDLGRALSDGRRTALSILLAHYPSTVFRLPAQRVDLQLSGHTHGGQIRLPGLGCVWTNDRISRQMSRGLHAVSGTLLHVNPGIGVSPPFPWRINCRPEVTLLTLQPVAPGPGDQRHAETAAVLSR